MGDAKYTRQEVEAILSRATEGERGEMSHDELVAAAREAGIDPSAVERAASEVRDERELTLARERRRSRRRRRFLEHLRAYVVVNAALFGFDFLPNGEIDWAIFPLLGWGIGLAFDAMAKLGPEDPDAAERRDLKELERLRRLRRRRQGERPALDVKLGPNFQVRVDLPGDRNAGDEDEIGVGQGSRRHRRRG
ncbi:MAG TPA: 2TM domain-containing protein [Polyangiaceae bacterium LLY-WYZ-14_1]|nr:2TM domain-containing protein [Polyangiaceae bacterium LLY-WYZ-14_1]